MNLTVFEAIGKTMKKDRLIDYLEKGEDEYYTEPDTFYLSYQDRTLILEALKNYYKYDDMDAKEIGEKP